MTATLQKKRLSKREPPNTKLIWISRRRISSPRLKTANTPPTHILRRRCKTAPKMKNRSRDLHHAPKSVADFAARRRQIILIVFWRDTCVPKNSSHGARAAAALRATSHKAQCILLKKRGRRKPSSFFEEIALRCMHAPQARTLRSVRRVFWHAHVAPKTIKIICRLRAAKSAAPFGA